MYKVEQANRRVLAAWGRRTPLARRAYDRARREIEQENQRLTSAWEALKATRRPSTSGPAASRREESTYAYRDWDSRQRPWDAEEKRWRDRVGNALAEILRLESDLDRQRTTTESRFRRRKDKASGIAARPRPGQARLRARAETGRGRLEEDPAGGITSTRR